MLSFIVQRFEKYLILELIAYTCVSEEEINTMVRNKTRPFVLTKF